jgi:hypothetical protein
VFEFSVLARARVPGIDDAGKGEALLQFNDALGGFGTRILFLAHLLAAYSSAYVSLQYPPMYNCLQYELDYEYLHTATPTWKFFARWHSSNTKRPSKPSPPHLCVLHAHMHVSG